MDQITVMKFLEEKKEYLFPNDEYSDVEIEEALSDAPDSFEFTLQTISFRKPSTMQIISVFPGSLGVDRFMLGDIKMGLLKYITLGGFYIWWIADIISAKKRCRAYNCKKLMKALEDPSVVANKTPAVNIDLDTAVKIGKAAAPAVKSLFKGAKDVGDSFYVK